MLKVREALPLVLDGHRILVRYPTVITDRETEAYAATL